MHIYVRICVPYYTYHRAPCAALFWNSEFTRFRIAKTKRLRRLFQYVLYLTRPKDIYPQRGLNTAKLLFCAAKLLHFFDICNFFSNIYEKNLHFYADLLYLWSMGDPKGMVDELIPQLYLF